MAEEAAVCASSFYNRRFMKSYLKTVFPAGFGSSMNEKGGGNKNHLTIKGLSPPKPIIATSLDNMLPIVSHPSMTLSISDKNNTAAGIAPNKESFMAWARGENIHAEMNDDDTFPGDKSQNDALDPFTDVAGPYFHEINRQGIIQQQTPRSNTPASVPSPRSCRTNTARRCCGTIPSTTRFTLRTRTSIF